MWFDCNLSIDRRTNDNITTTNASSVAEAVAPISTDRRPPRGSPGPARPGPPVRDQSGVEAGRRQWPAGRPTSGAPSRSIAYAANRPTDGPTDRRARLDAVSGGGDGGRGRAAWVAPDGTAPSREGRRLKGRARIRLDDDDETERCLDAANTRLHQSVSQRGVVAEPSMPAGASLCLADCDDLIDCANYTRRILSLYGRQTSLT